MRKTKSGHGRDCGFGGGFSEKKESRNISLHSFFLVAFRHCNDRSHYNGINRPSGAYTAFWETQKVSSQLRKSRLFSRCRILLFSRCHPLHSLHFCTIKGQLHQGIREYGICVIPILPRGIFDTLAFSKCVRVQGVQWGNPEKCWRISPHYLHFLHFQVPKCRKCRKCKAFTLIFLFIAPKPYGLV